MHTLLGRLQRDTTGATVVEYGMLIGVLSIVIIVGLQNFTNQLVNTWLIVAAATSNTQ